LPNPEAFLIGGLQAFSEVYHFRETERKNQGFSDQNDEKLKVCQGSVKHCGLRIFVV
jgi:hypothetical protein